LITIIITELILSLARNGKKKSSELFINTLRKDSGVKWNKTKKSTLREERSFPAHWRERPYGTADGRLSVLLNMGELSRLGEILALHCVPS